MKKVDRQALVRVGIVFALAFAIVAFMAWIDRK